MFKLSAPYSPAGDQPAAIKKIVKNINCDIPCQTMLGVTGSGKTFTMAAIIEQTQRPALIMAPNKTLAAQLFNEMQAFFPENAVEYFVSYYDYYQPEAYVAATDTFIEKDASINEYIEQMRLSATRAIVERKDVVIVASVSAIYGLGDPSMYLDMVLPLHIGQQISRRDILLKLASLQYRRNDYDLQRACYRVHGDIIDIFPAETDSHAIRVELFDKEVEQLRKFDPLTGEIISDLNNITIFPKSHYVTPKERLKNAVGLIKDELHERLEVLKKQELLVEMQRLEQRVAYDIEMINELGYCSGIEHYSRYLSNRAPGEPPPTLLDYLPKDSIVFVDESHVTLPQIGGMFKGDRSRKETLVRFGFRLPSALDNRPLQFEEFMRLVPQMICVSATPGKYELEFGGPITELVVRPTGLLDPVVTIAPSSSQVDHCLSKIKACCQRNERVIITTLTKKMAEQLTKYLQEQNIKVCYLHSDIDTVERVELIRKLRQGEIDVLVGINLLREGIDVPEVSFVAIFDADKEGFLRSDRSLIQTMGRAARHVAGEVVLYADKITDSMQRAIAETKRRRATQEAFNKANNITPRSAARAIAKEWREAEPEIKATISDIPRLESEMLAAAEKMDFEQAAKIRDLIAKIK